MRRLAPLSSDLCATFFHLLYLLSPYTFTILVVIRRRDVYVISRVPLWLDLFVSIKNSEDGKVLTFSAKLIVNVS